MEFIRCPSVHEATLPLESYSDLFVVFLSGLNKICTQIPLFIVIDKEVKLLLYLCIIR